MLTRSLIVCPSDRLPSFKAAVIAAQVDCIQVLAKFNGKMKFHTHIKGFEIALGDVDRMRVGPHEEIAFDHGHQILFAE